MKIVSVKNLTKTYSRFELKNVSLSLEEGSIVGVVGRNGAGKTTMLKALLGIIHPNSGEILFFGKSFQEHELEIKKQIGFVSGGIQFHPKKRLKVLTQITKTFYDDWDDNVYKKYLRVFKLDEEKKASELSEGMKVKYLLAVALSHHAKLLILDEPTSGLDPVSRDELLEIFLDIVEKEKVTILYSTHIITDLEKCASKIIYIREGEIKFEEELKALRKKYRMISGPVTLLDQYNRCQMIGLRIHNEEFEGMILEEEIPGEVHGGKIIVPSLEDLIVYLERDRGNNPKRICVAKKRQNGGYYD